MKYRPEATECDSREVNNTMDVTYKQSFKKKINLRRNLLKTRNLQLNLMRKLMRNEDYEKCKRLNLKKKMEWIKDIMNIELLKAMITHILRVHVI